MKEPKQLKKRSSSIARFFGHAKQGNVDIEAGETSAPSFGAIEPMPVICPRRLRCSLTPSSWPRVSLVKSPAPPSTDSMCE